MPSRVDSRIILCYHNDSVHAVPMRCQNAMKWLMDECDVSNLQMTSVYFIMDAESARPVVECEGLGQVPFIAGEFVRAQGVLRRGDRAMGFGIFVDSESVMNMDICDGLDDHHLWREGDGSALHSLEELFSLHSVDAERWIQFFN
jgi:hypothetical protein